jgi:hypothetical protein
LEGSRLIPEVLEGSELLEGSVLILEGFGLIHQRKMSAKGAQPCLSNTEHHIRRQFDDRESHSTGEFTTIRC